ncbi:MULTISPECIES: hypothetical protein [unclassified Burkholderia]|uniref:hypothetical protein n=1 Tax=unclassified Burkholderia TaxID=2613784 RepID=UPI001F122615|nr:MULTISPECIES: hypothetical protein [unclassified Burkholderia]
MPNAREHVFEAFSVAFVAQRVAARRIVESQHRKAAIGEMLGERAHEFVKPERLVTKRLANHDAVRAIACMKPADTSVELNGCHDPVLALYT